LYVHEFGFWSKTDNELIKESFGLEIWAKAGKDPGFSSVFIVLDGFI
jgi:hypothetical protein